MQFCGCRAYQRQTGYTTTGLVSATPLSQALVWPRVCLHPLLVLPTGFMWGLRWLRQTVSGRGGTSTGAGDSESNMKTAAVAPVQHTCRIVVPWWLGGATPSTIHRDSPETIQVHSFSFVVEWMTCPSRISVQQCCVKLDLFGFTGGEERALRCLFLCCGEERALRRPFRFQDVCSGRWVLSEQKDVLLALARDLPLATLTSCIIDAAGG